MLNAGGAVPYCKKPALCLDTHAQLPLKAADLVRMYLGTDSAQVQLARRSSSAIGIKAGSKKDSQITFLPCN